MIIFHSNYKISPLGQLEFMYIPNLKYGETFPVLISEKKHTCFLYLYIMYAESVTISLLIFL